MKKIFFLTIAACCIHAGISSQTLFTYGKHAVDAREFLRAYNKNNSQVPGDKAKAVREYLELFIKSKLKIQEAYERRYDTLLHIVQEVENLRTQVSENYMTDPEISKRLIKEAFDRSLKDIHVAHIFISFKNAVNIIDTVAAQKKRDEALQRLQSGVDFIKVAQQYSDDPAVNTNKASLGYITVFTLPYEFENAIYATPVGKYSAVVRSKAGYHIFKNLGERKAVGKIKAQQILLAFPPGASEKVKQQVSRTADSVYRKIMAGENFNRLASLLSNDYVTGAAGGVMPDIGVGQYDPSFEAALWSLAKDGAVSKPFLTAHGWHIVKRIALKPVVTDANDKLNQQDLLQKIMADSRWTNSRDFIYTQVKEKAGYKKFSYDDAALWNMSDSVLDLKPMTSGWAITANTPLFSIGDSVYNANNWVQYANMYRYKQDGSGAKPWEQVREEWVQYSMKEYFRQHLEDFNEDFRYQMDEFRDGNLFFEIMQQEIWNRAQTDTSALLNLYEKNKTKYTWNKSADAVVFYCPDEVTAKEAYTKIKLKPADWRNIVSLFGDKIVIDSSRYEWEQLPGAGKTIPAAGMIVNPVVNKSDQTASFAYIINVYPQVTQRSFAEARGLVINDYQEQLEKQWNETLNRKYPVKVDEKVLAEISK
jgi:peptidyl-prolyl cis-trans isomerase SurA